MDNALTACIWIQFAAAMLLFGASFFRLLLGRAAVDAGLVLWLRAATFAACASAVGWLTLEAANFGDGWSDAVNPAAILAVLRETSFGHVWTARLAIALFLVAVALAPPSRRAFRFGTGLSALFLASLALIGHAVMGEGVADIVHALSQAVHLLAGGAWIGALLPLWLILRRTGDDELAHLAVARFARLGYAAVALVLASGLVNTWFLIGNADALVATFYGRLLLFKVALVGGMLAFAAVNRLRLAPALTHGASARRRLMRNVAGEAALALAVLAAASLLGSSAPPL